MLVAVIIFLIVLVCCYVVARWLVTRPIAHIQSGAQRRTLHPIEQPIGPGASSVVASTDLDVKRELHKLKDGTQIFCQTMKSKKIAPTYVFVFFHGYTSHSDLYVEALSFFARHGALVLMPDLPCHGRSDGLLTYVPNWWSWVDQIWEVLELLVPPARGQKAKPLPVFAGGISLGGGLATCLAAQRPNFFDGVILIAPMLVVSDEIKPPWIVQQLFKFVLVPLLPTWPLTPTKSMDHLDFRVVAQGSRYCKCNPFSMQGLNSRLGSALSFGFTFPEWMEQKMKDVKTPFFVIHGKADKITDPEASERLHKEATAKDKTIKLVEGAYHCELFCCLPNNSKLIGMEWLPEQAEATQTCLDAIAEWISERV